MNLMRVPSESRLFRGIYRIAFPLADEATRGCTTNLAQSRAATFRGRCVARHRFLEKRLATLLWNTRPRSVRSVAHREHVVDTTRRSLRGLGCRIPTGRKRRILVQRVHRLPPRENGRGIYFVRRRLVETRIKTDCESRVVQGVMPLAMLFATDFLRLAKKARKHWTNFCGGIRGVKWISGVSESAGSQARAASLIARLAAENVREPARLHNSRGLAANVVAGSLHEVRAGRESLFF